MRIDDSIDLLKSYDDNLSIYKDFTKKIEFLIGEIINSNNLHVHSIASRVKDRLSFQNKIAKHENRYKTIDEITDVCGCRIICFFEDEVDKIVKIIKSEFQIDEENSADKRLLLDADRFGYLSVHLITLLDSRRCELIEYKRFPIIKIEIQIRSILQHAWAEIEHDLGYKSNLSVPRQVRRNFSRLAGLLEIADEQFINIRNKLESYEEELPAKIANTPDMVEIDLASLISFVKSNKVLKEIDSKIASLFNAIIESEINPSVIEGDLPTLKYLGISTIEQLERTLIENESLIVKFAARWIDEIYESFIPSISFLYLYYVLAAKTENEDVILEMLDIDNIGSQSERITICNKILSTYKEIST